MEAYRAHSLKRTKIVATLGPATREEHIIERLIKNGLNVARLNFSHDIHEEHKYRMDNVRKISKRLNKPIAVLLDLQGPKIRLGILNEDVVTLKEGTTITLYHSKEQVDDRIPVQFNIFPHLKEGARILINDGLIRLEVLKTGESHAECKVRVGGPIKTKKGVNLPDTKLPGVAFTEKDRIDLMFGIENKVDYVALSFVQDAEDIESLRKLIAKFDHHPKIVAKLETKEAVRNLKEIIEASDVVMVARGDLAVEVDQEDVPIIQREIIRLARKSHTPVIVATQMLESMVNNPEPTRAEVNDVATAVMDHVDAVMLSAETASGSYPVEAVTMMKRIITRVEHHHRETLTEYALATLEESSDQTTAIAAATSLLAHQLKAAMIVAATTSGKTAQRVASYRPPIPVAAVTDDEITYRQLAMVWGIKSFYVPHVKESQEELLRVLDEMKEIGYVKTGDKLVHVTGVKPYEIGGTSIIKVETVK